MPDNGAPGSQSFSSPQEPVETWIFPDGANPDEAGYPEQAYVSRGFDQQAYASQELGSREADAQAYDVPIGEAVSQTPTSAGPGEGESEGPTPAEEPEESEAPAIPNAPSASSPTFMMDNIANLAQEIGARPAATEEENRASLYAESVLSRSLRLDTAVEEFTCNSNFELIRTILCLISFVSAVVCLFLGVALIPALILSAIACVLYILDIFGRSPLAGLMKNGVSQNVVARFYPNGIPNGIAGGAAPSAAAAGDAAADAEAQDAGEDADARDSGRSRTHGSQPRRGARPRRKIIILAHIDTGKASREFADPLFGLLPALHYAEVIALILIPIVLLIRLITSAEGGLLVFFNILTVICALVALILPVLFILRSVAPYTPGANNNASGVAVLLEVARRLAEEGGNIGRRWGVSTEGEGNQATTAAAGLAAGPGAGPGEISMSGEAALREQGLIPEGAEFNYAYQGQGPAAGVGAAESQGILQGQPQAQGAYVNATASPLSVTGRAPTSGELAISLPKVSERDILQNASGGVGAASAAATGTLGVADASSANAIPAEGAIPGVAAVPRPSSGTGTIPLGDVAAQPPAGDAMVQAANSAQIGQGGAEAELQAAHGSGPVQAGVPDWFAQGLSRAKGRMADSNNGPVIVQRSRYAEALNALDTGAGDDDAQTQPTENKPGQVQLSESDEERIRQIQFSIQQQADTALNAVSDRSAKNAALAATLLETKAEGPADKPVPGSEADGHTDANGPHAGDGVADQVSAASETAESTKSEAAGDYATVEERTISFIPVAADLEKARGKNEELKRNSANIAGANVATQESATAGMATAEKATAGGPSTNAANAVRTTTGRSTTETATTGRSSRSLDLPSISVGQATTRPLGNTDRISRQRRLSNSLPSTTGPSSGTVTQGPVSQGPASSGPGPAADSQASYAATSPTAEASPSPGASAAAAAPTQTTQTDASSSGAIRAGGFIDGSRTGSFAPVGDEFIANRNSTDLYVDDVDDSAYATNVTETGAMISEGYVQIPRSLRERIRSRFRRRKRDGSDEVSLKDTLGVGDDFDARSVGAARGSWESFRDDDPVYGNNAMGAGRSTAGRGAGYGQENVPDDGWNGGAYSTERARRNAAASSGEGMGTQRRRSIASPFGGIAFDFEDISAEERALIEQFRAGHLRYDVWLVALGANLENNAGIQAFYDAHSDEIRGSFVIDLSSCGAGELSLVESAGIFQQGASSIRLRRQAAKAAASVGLHLGACSMRWWDTAGQFTSRHGLPTLHIAGVEGNGRPAYLGDVGDTPDVIDEKQLDDCASLVSEIIHNL